MTPLRAILLAAVAAVVIVSLLPQESPQQQAVSTAEPAATPGNSTPPSRPPAARCTASDFTVEKFTSRVVDDCRRTPCPVLKLTGFLKNNCARLAGAQIKIVALDKNGDLIDTYEGWPASTRNIAPGDAYAFDMGPGMRYSPNMARFTIQVIDARTW